MGWTLFLATENPSNKFPHILSDRVADMDAIGLIIPIIAKFRILKKLAHQRPMAIYPMSKDYPKFSTEEPKFIKFIDCLAATRCVGVVQSGKIQQSDD
jgi:hypothetical protein